MTYELEDYSHNIYLVWFEDQRRVILKVRDTVALLAYDDRNTSEQEARSAQIWAGSQLGLPLVL